MSNYKEQFTDYIHELQDEICRGLEEVDGGATFQEDQWERPGGGGGKTRVIANGNVFEKGGVNTSAVYGELPPVMQKHFGVEEAEFFACGISLVIHPKSPMVPTVHANFRMFEMYREGELVDAWFGGGADLTPWYLWEEDAAHFHQVFKEACDPFGEDLYPRFKKDCDEYFWNHHRNEARGIGGIFFDYLKPDGKRDRQFWYDFTTAMGRSFLKTYTPIVEKRKFENYSDEQVYFHELRRGRYAEFNMIHDRGTLFGLKTNGRIESILMSLPPRVRWDYAPQVEEGSREATLIHALANPRDWAALTV